MLVGIAYQISIGKFPVLNNYKKKKKCPGKNEKTSESRKDWKI